MLTSRFAFSLLALVVASRCLAADGLPPLPAVPEGGTPVLAEDWQPEIVTNWKGKAEFGGIEPSALGMKLTTVQKPEFLYSLQAQLLNQAPVKAGDTMLIRFAARSLKAEAATGATRLTATFGKASPPWTRGEQIELGLTGEWQRFDAAFKCPVDFAEKEAQFTFTFGYTPQQVEVADVTILNYGPKLPLSTFPKPKRYASQLPPAMVDRELTRIAAMRAELDAIKDPSPANGKTIYVSADAKAGGDGSKEKPFASIPRGLDAAEPGDTVLVGAGEYREPKGVSFKKSGKPDAWIKLKAAPGAKPKIVSSNWSGIECAFGIAYIEIDGFEVVWVKDADVKAEEAGVQIHGSGIATMYATHHIRILNNVVHGFGTGGIISLDCDYLHVEGNTIYDCAKTSPYGGSGISLCRAFDFDNYAGYHNVIRRNVCYDNENKVIVLVTSGGTGHTLTDGNGIIIDVFKRSRANPLKRHNLDRDGPIKPYNGRTLIENNLCFNNGGRGVHVFRSEKVDVINNTCYMNQRTPEINGGEFTAIQATDIVIANNVGISREGKRVCGPDGSTGFVIWSHNLLSGDNALIHTDSITDADPKFVGAKLDAKPEAFRLQPDSPALGKGLALVAPHDDLDGKPRDKSVIDLGAFQISK